MPDSFVHLHCHTEFSTLDGMVRVEAAVKKAKAMGMPALAITDHGSPIPCPPAKALRK